RCAGLRPLLRQPRDVEVVPLRRFSRRKADWRRLIVGPIGEVATLSCPVDPTCCLVPGCAIGSTGAVTRRPGSLTPTPLRPASADGVGRGQGLEVIQRKRGALDGGARGNIAQRKADQGARDSVDVGADRDM